MQEVQVEDDCEQVSQGEVHGSQVFSSVLKKLAGQEARH